jgi:hypothetical protein
MDNRPRSSAERAVEDLGLVLTGAGWEQVMAESYFPPLTAAEVSTALYRKRSQGGVSWRYDASVSDAGRVWVISWETAHEGHTRMQGTIGRSLYTMSLEGEPHERPRKVFPVALRFSLWALLWFWPALIIWGAAWKAAALWKAARRKSIVWFLVLLVAPTMGVLEAFYIFALARRRPDV